MTLFGGKDDEILKNDKQNPLYRAYTDWPKQRSNRSKSNKKMVTINTVKNVILKMVAC